MYAIAGMLLASGIFLAAFVGVAEEAVYRKEAEMIDRTVIWLVRSFASPAFDKLMIWITALGTGYAYAVLAPPLALILWLLRRRRETVLLVLSLGGGIFLNNMLKHLFERARPELFKVVSAAGYSFPSGHAMVSLCFYGVLAYIICRTLGRLPIRIAVYGSTAILVTAIGVSRVYLGVHYPSDVLAGYLAGGMWLTFCVSLLWWRELPENRSS